MRQHAEGSERRKVTNSMVSPSVRKESSPCASVGILGAMVRGLL